MPSRVECRGCHGTDVSIVKREPVDLGKYVYYNITYRCNTCGALFSSNEHRT
jgi:uncharacterized Zn finger protein